MRILLIAWFGCAAPSTEPAVKNAVPDRTPPPTSLVGRWRVIGCETSPMDPADCARGQIVFTTDRVTIDVPAAEHISHAYKLVSSSTRHIVLNIDGEDSDIMLDANGEATGARSGSTAGSGGCRSSEHRRRHPSDAAADLVITTVVD